MISPDITAIVRLDPLTTTKLKDEDQMGSTYIYI
jgi:hypothetical protein